MVRGRGTASKGKSRSLENIKPTAKVKTRGSTTHTKKASPNKPKSKNDEAVDSGDTDAPSDDEGEAYEASETEGLDSDALDEESDVSGSGKKRKKSQRSPKKKGNVSPQKRRRKKVEDDEDEEEEMPEGLTVVGEVVRAPTEGRGKIPIPCLTHD